MLAPLDCEVQLVWNSGNKPLFWNKTQVYFIYGKNMLFQLLFHIQYNWISITFMSTSFEDHWLQARLWIMNYEMMDRERKGLNSTLNHREGFKNFAIKRRTP